MGSWVLRRACAQLACWRRRGHDIEVAVNLSPRQFRQKELLQTVASVLAETGLAAGHLELEITEGTAMARAEQTVSILDELHRIGVSLAYLKRFPLHCLKIDRSFVADLGQDPHSEAIVPATISLAHTLGLKVVAEGVETRSQHDFLVRAGCDYGQGHLYSHPLPADEFELLMGRT
jgi:EAL domain-containing protein (putative c-di-GMP-specific phosphodiesterase class I)